MDNIQNLIGRTVRRVTFSIQNGSDYYMLFSVLELLENDMQDYDEFCNSTSQHIYRSDASSSKNLYNIYMAIDIMTLTDDFIRHPETSFVVYGTQYKFYSNKLRLRPSINEPPYILSDSYHDNKAEIQNVLPSRQCSKALYAYITNDNIAGGIIEKNEYLKKQLQKVSVEKYGVDLSLFPEHFGNIYLLQYNPFFRQIDFSSSSNPNGLYVNFKFRKGVSGKLNMRLSSKNKAGFYSFEVDKPIDTSKSDYFIDLPTEPDVLSVKVFDKKDNLIYYNDDMRFIQRIDFTMNVKAKDLKLKVEEKTGITETNVEKYESISHSIGSSKEQDAVLGEANTKNAYLTLEKSLQFVLLDGDKNKKQENIAKAKSIIRQILNKARKRCVICDPYFNHRDIVEYVFSMSSMSVLTRILSSKDFIAKNAEEAKKTAQIIEEDIERYNTRVGGNIQFRLLTGRSPLHDRFIIIDDDVWMLGSSFNEFGNRATTITKLPPVSCAKIYGLAEEWWSDDKYSISLKDYVGD